MSNEVIKHNTSIALSWVAATGTSEVMVCKNPDFSDTSPESDGTTTGSSYSFTAGGGNGKYYWKRRFNSGSGYAPWLEINSYWLDTTASADLALTDSNWKLVNALAVTDLYSFEINPLGEKIYPQNMFRSSNRNLTGGLVYQFIALKTKIQLGFSQQSYIGVSGKAEFQRFYNMRNDKYLVKRSTAQDNSNYTYNIWKVDFTDPLQMENTGDLSLNFEEI